MRLPDTVETLNADPSPPVAADVLVMVLVVDWVKEPLPITESFNDARILLLVLELV